jgi:hypothetical protein
MADPNPNLNPGLHRQDRFTPASNRPPEHLSATDEDAPDRKIDNARSSGPKAPFDVFTPKGFRPFYPDRPEPPQSSEYLPDNPFNPHGQPSQSLPQQATPLTSEQGVLTIDDMADQERMNTIAMTQDGLAPDNPQNPRGTPDYIVEGLTDPDAEPGMHSIQPTSGTAGQPVTLTVLGQGFTDQSQISVDGAPLAATNFVNGNRLTGDYTPDIAGTKQVSVDGLPAQPFEVA